MLSVLDAGFSNLRCRDSDGTLCCDSRAQRRGRLYRYVPSLPGCISEGDTRQEALDNIREAIALYLEPVEDEGTPILSPHNPPNGG